MPGAKHFSHIAFVSLYISLLTIDIMGNFLVMFTFYNRDRLRYYALFTTTCLLIVCRFLDIGTLRVNTVVSCMIQSGSINSFQYSSTLIFLEKRMFFILNLQVLSLQKRVCGVQVRGGDQGVRCMSNAFIKCFSYNQKLSKCFPFSSIHISSSIILKQSSNSSFTGMSIDNHQHFSKFAFIIC